MPDDRTGRAPAAGRGEMGNAPAGPAASAAPQDFEEAVEAPPTRSRVRAARALAIAADSLQLFLFPLFGEGFASPVNDLLDMGVALALVRLVGFHWVFLPGIVAEAVPGLDLAPTWTAAVLFATAGSGSPARTRAGRIARIALVVAALALGAFALLFWQRR